MQHTPRHPQQPSTRRPFNLVLLAALSMALGSACDLDVKAPKSKDVESGESESGSSDVDGDGDGDLESDSEVPSGDGDDAPSDSENGGAGSGAQMMPGPFGSNPGDGDGDGDQPGEGPILPMDHVPTDDCPQGGVDGCGICGGDNSTCAGCDRIPNSGLSLDACGVCGGDGQGCAGCDGVSNSGKMLDACGVCDGDGTGCLGCDGVLNSGVVLDACGDCGGTGASCTGCDGFVNSGLVLDACGDCGGDGSRCAVHQGSPVESGSIQLGPIGVAIGEGGLHAPVEFTVQQAPLPAALPIGFTALGPVQNISVDYADNLARPVSLTFGPLEVSADGVPAVLHYNATAGRWEQTTTLDWDSAAGTLVVESISYSEFVPGEWSTVEPPPEWFVGAARNPARTFDPVLHGFAGKNIASHFTVVGACMGGAGYSSWFYRMHSEEDLAQAYSPVLSQLVMTRAFLSVEQSYDTEFRQRLAGSTGTATQTVMQQLKQVLYRFDEPVLLGLMDLDAGDMHVVLAYAYSDSAIRVYDSEYPLEYRNILIDTDTSEAFAYTSSGTSYEALLPMYEPSYSNAFDDFEYIHNETRPVATHESPWIRRNSPSETWTATVEVEAEVHAFEDPPEGVPLTWTAAMLVRESFFEGDSELLRLDPSMTSWAIVQQEPLRLGHTRFSLLMGEPDSHLGTSDHELTRFHVVRLSECSLDWQCEGALPYCELDAGTGGFCTASCAVLECPEAMTCHELDGTGATCLLPCSDNPDPPTTFACPEPFTCTQGACLPPVCGALGEACCAGTSCRDYGTQCGSQGICECDPDNPLNYETGSCGPWRTVGDVTISQPSDWYQLNGVRVVTGRLRIYAPQPAGANLELGLTRVDGYLHVGGDDIVDLAGLEHLESVGGPLWIHSNPDLKSIDALANLETVGRIYDRGDGIFAMEGLDIQSNPQLQSLDGLQGLSYLPFLFVRDCPSLTSLDGLENLVEVGAHMRVTLNPGLGNLSGLSSLSRVGMAEECASGILSSHRQTGSSLSGCLLAVNANAGISSLSGLDGLREVVNGSWVNGNHALTDASALSGIVEGGIDVGNNCMLDQQGVNDLQELTEGTVSGWGNGDCLVEP